MGSDIMRLPYRGGAWNSGANAGLAALNLGDSRANTNTNIGFRPAFGSSQKATPHGALSSALSKGCRCLGYRRKTEQAAPVRRAADFKALMYDQIISFDNLHQAALRCLCGKRTSPAALRYMQRLEEHLHDTHNHLLHDSYQPGGYEEFYVFEPKQRLISAPRFVDRVVHRAIMNVLEPTLDPRFIFDSYACRKGKGVHAGANRAQRWMRAIRQAHGPLFCLKADISKYFASIDHARLKAILRRHIHCDRTLRLLDAIIDSSPGRPGVGIPLGNLTSQLFANLYLNELDRYAKHDLGIRYYIRYMDDFVVLHHDKAQLQAWRARIEQFLWSALRLTTNSKTQIFPVGPDNGRALDFLGYRIYPTHRLLRKNSIKRIRYKLRRFKRAIAAGRLTAGDCRPCIQSWCAHAAHANTWRLRCSLFNISSGANR